MVVETSEQMIADLKTKIQLLDDRIEELQHLRELTEGGSNGNFTTKFSNIYTLYERRDLLNHRLASLYRCKI